jgi:hypothetical protein
MKIDDYAPQQSELFSLKETSEVIESVHDLTADDVERKKKKRPKLLGIVCGRSDCKRELHCFNDRQSARIRTQSERRTADGTCRDCGVKLADFDKVRVRDLMTVTAKFGCFQREWIRHFFFHVPITPRIEKYARQHGAKGLSKILEDQLTKKQMLKYMPALDFKQTAMLDGTIVHWARHATASCCRACMKYWHGIPLDRELTPEDVRYFRDLGMRFILLRIPDLQPAAVGAHLGSYSADSVSRSL